MSEKPTPKLLESLAELRAQGIPFLPVEVLKAWPGNPNRHQPGVPQLLRIIQRYGWTIPIVVRAEADDNGQHEISAGHGRLIAAAEELGLEAVPVIFRNFSEHDSHAYGLADNRAPDFSTEDGPALMAVLDELIANDGQQDVIDAGWTVADLDELAASLDGDKPPPPEPPTPDPPKDPITKLGDVWVLGDHRLMCGDSFDADTCAALIDGVKIAVVYTDPPYGMNLDTDFSKIKGTAKSPNAKGYKYDPVEGDDRDFEFARFEWLSGIAEQFWWGADYYCQQLPAGGSWFVWEKRQEADEKMIGNDFELCWSKSRHKRRVIRRRWVGWAATEAGEKRKHPTQKPVNLCEGFLIDFSSDGDVVLDLFGGSGSTLLACENSGRVCRMMEMSPKYCDVIIQRWEQMTGGKAKRETTNA